MFKTNAIIQKKIILKYHNQKKMLKIGYGWYENKCLSVHLQWEGKCWHRYNRIFIMHILLLCIKVNSYVAHMLYAWWFSHNTAVTIPGKKTSFTWTHIPLYLIGELVIPIQIERKNWIH